MQGAKSSVGNLTRSGCFHKKITRTVKQRKHLQVKRDGGNTAISTLGPRVDLKSANELQQKQLDDNQGNVNTDSVFDDIKELFLISFVCDKGLRLVFSREHLPFKDTC